jgi:hypothetical protein
MTIALTFASATTVRMIDGIHGDATYGRTTSEPATASSLPKRPMLMVRIGDNANGGAAVYVD